MARPRGDFPSPAAVISELGRAFGEGDRFVDRHVGPREEDVRQMVKYLGHSSLEELAGVVVPKAIQFGRDLDLPGALTESDALAELRTIASQNKVVRSLIGMGYSDCITPGVIQRNILESPGWYTQYTPYQAEIAQGRLEALLNFQTMVADLTGMEVAGASLLDEGTAAAEAMTMSMQASENRAALHYFISDKCHPQTIAVVETRALPLGVKVVVGDPETASLDNQFFGCLLQYPGTDGKVSDLVPLIAKAHEQKLVVTVGADLLSLVLLKSPGEMDADIVVGNSQRFGVPLGFGGPHAGFLATRATYQRRMPGRIVGVSKDRHGSPAIRMVLQTREQHIRREKATSNICTAQVLLAVISSMYAVYHGPEGLQKIAARVHALSVLFALGLRRLGFAVNDAAFFDTVGVTLTGPERDRVFADALTSKINLRKWETGGLLVAFDERTTEAEVQTLFEVFAGQAAKKISLDALKKDAQCRTPIPQELRRTSAYLTHPVFHTHRSETEILRYLKKLEGKDLSLTHSMIPLGSCTMKLNATAELLPITWPEWNSIHPFAPADQTLGYRKLFDDLESWLATVTGFSAVSLQPNSGAQGEYAGLLVIRAYHESRGESFRNVCLIPKSAHGTNPASAVLCGMKVVGIESDQHGNIDVVDFQKKVEKHAHELAALMVTYPSTHGVFEGGIRELCDMVHKNGGQVYMDGANMNAQVGLCRPGDFGADVCHLNLHKTFCIPHGGGGPGMGPICVRSHLAEFLPGHPVIKTGGTKAIGPVSSAPWGSASILPISWMYVRMMGSRGLKTATEVAILNANYIAKKLEGHYPVLYRGQSKFVAHECILDLRELKKEADIEVDDVAKRLMDYGFHAPTISWPVAGTMMVEPTESESKEELDRFCDAMVAIREEVRAVKEGRADRTDNVLKNAPHTAAEIAGEAWVHPYSRQQAAYPVAWVAERKFWPSVARIDNAYGDRNLFCSCIPVEGMEPAGN